MKKSLLLVFFAVAAAFGLSSPTDRGYTVVTLPDGESLAGDGEGGFCYFTEETDPSLNRWQAGQVETLVRQSQLSGTTFRSTAYPYQEQTYRRILCFPKDPPLFLAYSRRLPSGTHFASLFSGKDQLLTTSPPQAIKVQPIGQLGQLDRMFFGGISISRSAGRNFMVSWLGDKDSSENLDIGGLELKQPLSQPFALLGNSEGSPFVGSGSSCASGTGYWLIAAKNHINPSSPDLSASVAYYDRTGKLTIVKETPQWITSIECDMSGAVVPYLENGVPKISRFNELQPSLEVPLMVGNNFAGYTLRKIVSLEVLPDGTIYFIASTSRGNVLFRLVPKSVMPELVKAPGEAPSGIPQNLVLSGNIVGVQQLLDKTDTNFLLTRGPVITNLKAEPATVEPGQLVKISWDLIGQAKSMTFNPGNVTYTGPGHYEIVVYPTATTSYTISIEWAGGPPITKSVTVTVLLPPISPPEILGIANGASFDLNQPLAPGTIFSLFGKNLGTAEQAKGFPLPGKLGGAKITICGADAPLFASTGPMTRPEGGQLWQINGVVPSIASPPTCEVVVSVDQKSPTAALTARAQVKISSKSEETLALFTYTGFHPNGAQTQEPIITNQQGQLIAPPGVSIPGADPAMFTQARACEAITLWPTGGGRTIPSVADGEPASDTSLARMEISPVVQIYGVDAEVLFAGIAPGFAGLYQINVRVPCEATPGEQWLWFGRLPNTGKVYKIWIQ